MTRIIQVQILARTVDFGASDAPMDPAKLASGNLLQLPTVMGAVVPIVNLPGIAPNQLRLTGEVIADIYAGKITKWNDPRITEINSGLPLPNLAIAPVYRANGSGTTFIFTSYLAAKSGEWRERVGAATSVKWPMGSGARGNDGVAATVTNTKGGIGYVEDAYATTLASRRTIECDMRRAQYSDPSAWAVSRSSASPSLFSYVR